MDYDTRMAILCNDLQTMRLKIESLPPHPMLIDALSAMQRAHSAINIARSDFHKKRMKELCQ